MGNGWHMEVNIPSLSLSCGGMSVYEYHCTGVD